ncbi:MAG: hypothetical protein ACLVHY_06735 [Gemmiger sp.]
MAFYADADLDACIAQCTGRNVTAINPSPQTDHHALPAGTQPVERGGYQSEKGALPVVCLSFPTFMCPNSFR